MAGPETREMYGEIATLIGSVAKALALTDADVIAAVERGTLTLAFDTDQNGHRFVEASYEGRRARVYQGAIKHGPGT